MNRTLIENKKAQALMYVAEEGTGMPIQTTKNKCTHARAWAYHPFYRLFENYQFYFCGMNSERKTFNMFKTNIL